MKKLLFLAAYIVFHFSLNAQPTAYLKIANRGVLQQVIHVSAGGYAVAAYDSAYKIQVYRLSENFDLMWSFKLTDANVAGLWPKIAEANDGSFYLMTSSYEHSGSTLIVKLSSTGSVLWQKNYYVNGGNLSSFALSKAVSGDNGFLFGGGQCALSNDVIKCDANGNIEWQYQFFYTLSSGVVTCWSIIPDGNGYVVSSGYNINSLLTLKLDANGSLQSHTAYTYSAMQIVPTRIVKLNQSGGYAIMGNYNSTNNNKTEFVAILNNVLALQSFSELTVTYTQFILNDICAINNGRNVVVCGSIYDNSVFTNVLINLTSTGSILWKKRSSGNVGTLKNVELYGLTAGNNNIIAVGGGSNEGALAAVIDTNGNGFCNETAFNMTNVHPVLTLQSGLVTPAAATVQKANVNYTYVSYTSFNKYLYCGNLSGINEAQQNHTNEIIIYPNPASDQLFIIMETGLALQVEVYDVFGRSIIEAQNFISGDALYIGNLKRGVYYLRTSSYDKIGWVKTISFYKD